MTRQHTVWMCGMPSEPDRLSEMDPGGDAVGFELLLLGPALPSGLMPGSLLHASSPRSGSEKIRMTPCLHFGA